MRKYLLCFLLLPLLLTTAQTNGIWQNYTDMKTTNIVDAEKNIVLAATSGGAYLFNQTDSTFKLFTKSEGLESQNLTAMTLDNNNQVWFGADNGAINILNTKTNEVNTVLDISRTDKIQKRINNLFVSEDTIFVASDFGLSLINSKTLSLGDSFLKFGNFPSETRVVSSFKNNLIYLCTDKGVAVQKQAATNLTAPESWNTYSLDTDINAAIVYKIVSFENQILLATNRGIMKFNNYRWQHLILTNKNTSDMVINSGILFIVQNNSVYSYTSTTGSQLLFTSADKINSIAVTAPDNIFIATDNGVSIYKGQTYLKTIFPNGPKANLFSSVTIEANGTLWAATGKDVTGVGVYSFDGNSWTTFDKENTPILKTNAYHKVFTSSDKSKVYFCNWGNGYIEYDNGKMKRYDTQNTPMKGISTAPQFLVINSVQTDSKGNVWSLNFWSASAEPLAVITPDSTWFTFNFSNQSITNTDLMDNMVIDQYDTKWFTVRNKGLYYFNENNTLDDKSDDIVGRLTTTNGLTSGAISALAVDKQGELWVGKTPGINIIFSPNNPQQSQIIDLPAFRNQLITFIAVDAINRKWIGTKSGVFLMSPDGFTVIAQYNSKNSPIPNDDIKSIAMDQNSGTVYFGTDYGLSSLTTDAVAPPETMGELFVFPNPFNIDNFNYKSLNIKGLVKDSEIKIYSISGKLIKILKAGSSESPGGSLAHWNGRNDKNELVPSGIYLIVAYDRDGTNVATSKVAVLRN